MKSYLVSLIIALIVCFASLFGSNHALSQKFAYPETPKQPVTENIFGKLVVDNYRWLEDVNSEKVRAWVKMQSDLTDKMLDKILRGIR